MNIKLLIAYDGKDFLGWQKTKEGRTVENELEKALQTALQHPVKLQAASRTDRGVHALEQVVNFLTEKEIDFGKLRSSLNKLLPKDIRIFLIEKENDDFHPTIQARGKTYLYQISTQKVLPPHMRRYYWHIPYPLDQKKMIDATQAFLGEHDFSAFCNLDCDDGVRRITSIDIERKEDDFFFRVSGNHFLYKMVRNIVGTLAYVGLGKIEDVFSILLAKDRRRAGITAPACGLFLEKVYYSAPKKPSV